MIGSRVILLRVALWGVLKIVLVEADLTDVRPLGASRPTRTAPVTVLKARRGSRQASSRRPRTLRWLLFEAQTVSSKASLGQFQVLRHQRPKAELVGHKPHHRTSHGRSGVPARVRKGERRPKIPPP